jgi:hypothetical protein
MTRRQRLLVSVRGSIEALAAAKGGAQIADVEYPASALGTPYPLNIRSVRNCLHRANFEDVLVSTNIGEVQTIRASACQAALGVAVAGADLIKFGLAEQTLKSASYLGEILIRTVHELASSEKRLYPSVFVDEDMRRFFDPLEEGPELAENINADGVLIDTFNKLIGKGLLDHYKLDQIAEFVESMHKIGREAWIAGSITLEELPELWQTGADVICVRGAACAPSRGAGRFGEIKSEIVKNIVATIPE